MLRRFVIALIPAVVIVSAMFLNPSPAFAANPSDPDGAPETTNLAGRPVNGYSYDSINNRPLFYNATTNAYENDSGTGHGIAYAKVNGNISLLYPWHGRIGDYNSEYDYKTIYAVNGSAIGYFEPDRCTGSGATLDCARDHDLAVITLYAGNWPANLNRVYRGSGSSPTYWTITDPIPSGLGCVGLTDLSEWGYIAEQNFQNDHTTSWAYRPGELINFASYDNVGNPARCSVQTDLESHSYQCQINGGSNCSRDSGSPWIRANEINTVFGITSAQAPSGVHIGDLILTPLYDGMKILYNYWQSQGSTAFICKSSNCSS